MAGTHGVPLGASWREAWSHPGFRWRAIATGPAFFVTLGLLASFVKWVERRPGVVLADPLLAALRPRDVTWLTFALIYAGIVGALVLVAGRPRTLVTGLQAYVILALARMAVMWVTPLDPPPGMILLEDPLAQGIGGATHALSRDLFFSGHTSTLFLVALAVPSPRFRTLFFGCAAAVGACVLVQHVHYSVDVFAAPFFALGAWHAAQALWPRSASPEN